MLASALTSSFFVSSLAKSGWLADCVRARERAEPPSNPSYNEAEKIPEREDKDSGAGADDDDNEVIGKKKPL